VATESESEHVCVLQASGKIFCWGNNENGQLGNGGTSNSDNPAQVSGITNAVQVAVGSDHSCALLSDSTVSCWGANFGGQLGDGTTNPHHTPAPVPGLSRVAHIATGGDVTYAQMADGTVQVWGFNTQSQFGDGTTSAGRPSPGLIPGLTGVAVISAGLQHQCALLTNNTVVCWGKNQQGQLGNGTTTDSAVPVTVRF
jgi:alpha-tubulin suppressor-like RCC1 family protein